MRLGDMIGLGFANLWRTKLRTFLTTMGVVIGIGALTSMISFGTGMEKNITDAFRKNDLFTSIYITAQGINLGEVAQGDISGVLGNQAERPAPLNDSTVDVIRNMKEVEVVFPDMSFQAKAGLLERTRDVRVVELPYYMRKYPPYNNVTYGDFFGSDTSSRVLINWTCLRKMNILVDDPVNPLTLDEEDKKKGMILVSPDSIIGRPVVLTTATLDFPSMFLGMLGLLAQNQKLPLKENTTRLIIGGIIKSSGPFESRNIRGDIFVPLKTAEKIPKLAVNNILDMLGGDNNPGTYNSVYVRVKDPGLVEQVVAKLKNMNLNVLALTEQLKDISRQFLIMDGFLGAIGTIALIVAGLGIMNTMIMSILERTREIGIMKAIGGSEPQIRMIFFVEAAVIGFIGAIFGLVLGWMVTLIANRIANAQLLPMGEGPVNFFYFPMWLIFGAIAFSIILSLIAGVYPAYRAARVDPVKALRHD